MSVAITRPLPPTASRGTNREIARPGADVSDHIPGLDRQSRHDLFRMLHRVSTLPFEHGDIALGPGVTDHLAELFAGVDQREFLVIQKPAIVPETGFEHGLDSFKGCV